LGFWFFPGVFFFSGFVFFWVLGFFFWVWWGLGVVVWGGGGGWGASPVCERLESPAVGVARGRVRLSF